jgi:hypothetical protein
MSKLTCTQIKAAVGLVALKHNLQVDWSSEDSFTWITMWRDGVKFKAEEAALISQEIANASGFDFYLNKIIADGFEGALDAYIRKVTPDEVPQRYVEHGNTKIDDYGEQFVAQ